MVLAINNGETAETVARTAGQKGYHFPVLLDPNGDVHRAYEVRQRPTTVIVGPGGQVQAFLVGAHDLDAIRAFLTSRSKFEQGS